MKVVITGATGNVGTSVIEALGRDASIEITGIARRRPKLQPDNVTWTTADVARDDLTDHFRGADVVIHLAWLIQPSHDRARTRSVNFDGSRRVFETARRAGVKRIVYSSSVGAYSPGPKDKRVDETWPTGGVDTSFYATDKADVEALLDDFEAAHPDIAVVRMRPGLIFKRDAATGIRKLFVGPLVPAWLMNPALIPVVPDLERLRFQAVHSLDVGEAYRLAALGDARGAFNLAADPVLDPAELGRLLGAKPAPVSRRALCVLVDATWRARLQPTPAGWLDMALAVPLMDTTRARDELGWTPRHSSGSALLELLDGMRRHAKAPTPPLTAGPA